MSSVKDNNDGSPMLFIDTEFNEFGGELISMGIVDLSGNEFYEVIERKPDFVYTPWVKENIIPILDKDGINSFEFSCKLEQFLKNYKYGFTIIADWPDDIKYFCQSIILGPGEMMDIPYPYFGMVVDIGLSSSESKVLHNALEDAKAIKNSWVKHRKKSL